MKKLRPRGVKQPAQGHMKQMAELRFTPSSFNSKSRILSTVPCCFPLSTSLLTTGRRRPHRRGGPLCQASFVGWPHPAGCWKFGHVWAPDTRAQLSETLSTSAGGSSDPQGLPGGTEIITWSQQYWRLEPPDSFISRQRQRYK